MTSVNLSRWLMDHQLSDLEPKMGGMLTLEGLLHLDEKDARCIYNVIGLDTSQIDRLITSIKQETPPSSQQHLSDHSRSTHSTTVDELEDKQDFDTDSMDIVPQMHYNIHSNDDQHYPVWPLIIPDNCTYNTNTGKLTVHHDKPRDKLQVYKPALEYIRQISSKVATISIVGRARTGKSLVAGELYAPDVTPCPFDLGHLMDACTYGIWVSAKPIQHPHERDTVVLIFDVEGTGFYEAKKQNDMQLMVITLLLSSYFIYNSKGAFDAPALEEIKFVAELTERIQATPNDDSGDDFKKFFPIFMWLLRDVHLESVIDDKNVSIREYFTQRVLKKERGFNRSVKDRQWIRTVFLQMFQKYDAFTLPMPHANKAVLQRLGDVDRSELETAFVDGLKQFCDKVMRDTKCKVLFSKKPDGTDDYIYCTGSHLSEWIQQCIQSVNNPDKIPEISSMTEAVMANVYRESKKAAITQYETLLGAGLMRLRGNNNQQPLNDNEITALHLQVFNTVLNEKGNSLQICEDADEKSNSLIYKQQQKIFHELCDEIGHNTNVKQIGAKGILYQILSINMKLSVKHCNAWLDQHFSLVIEPMLKNPKQYEAKDVITKFNELETNYYSQCKGPAMNDCWKQFKSQRMQESVQYFKKMKGFKMELLKAEQEAAIEREQSRHLAKQIEDNKKEMEQQRKLMQDEMARAEAARRQQEQEYKRQIEAAQQRMQDMQSSQFTELAKAMQTSTAEMTANMMKIQAENNKTSQQMTMNMMQIMKEIANRPPPKPVIIEKEVDTGCVIL